jgi:hypothetical protein
MEELFTCVRQCVKIFIWIYITYLNHFSENIIDPYFHMQNNFTPELCIYIKRFYFNREIKCLYAVEFNS